MPRPDPSTVSIDAFRQLVGAVPGEVEGLLKSGTIKRAAPGRVGLIEATRAFILHIKTNARDASLTAAMADARAARAEATELTLSILTRDLVADEEIEAGLQHLVGAILETTGGLAARVSREPADRAKIEAWRNEKQFELSDDVDKLAR